MKSINWIFIFICAFCGQGIGIGKEIKLAEVEGICRFEPFVPFIFFGFNDTVPINDDVIDTIALRVMRNPGCYVEFYGYIAPSERGGGIRAEEELARKRAKVVVDFISKKYPDLIGRISEGKGIYEFRKASLKPENLNAHVEPEITFKDGKTRIIYTTEAKKKWTYYADAVVADFSGYARRILLSNPDAFVVVRILDLHDEPSGMNLVYLLEKKLMKGIGKELSSKVLVTFESGEKENEARAELMISGSYLLWAPCKSPTNLCSVAFYGDSLVKLPPYASETASNCFIRSKTGLPLAYNVFGKFSIFSTLSPFFNFFDDIVLCCDSLTTTYELKVDELEFQLTSMIFASDTAYNSNMPFVLSLVGRTVAAYSGKLDSMNISVELLRPISQGLSSAPSKLENFVDYLRKAIGYAARVEPEKLENWFVSNKIHIESGYRGNEENSGFGDMFALSIKLFKSRR